MAPVESPGRASSRPGQKASVGTALGEGSAGRASARHRRAAFVESALGSLLRRFYTSETFRALGYVRLGDYVAERLGVSLRTAQEWMRVDDALSRLPLISAAFHGGEITSAHVRLLTRVATPEDESAWLSRARWMDVRRLARAVAAAIRERAGGDVPEAADLTEEDDSIALEIRAPVWLMRWWRETVVFAGQLVGRALRPGECLGVVLAENASGTGAVLAGAGGAEARGAMPDEGSGSQTTPSVVPSTPQSLSMVMSGTEAAVSSPCERACGSAAVADDGEPDAEAERLDASLRELAASRQRHEAEMATHLACVRADGTYLDERFRSLEQYARERLGLSARQMYYLLSLGRTLERLPDLRRAFVAGRVTLRQALLCGRVAEKATTAAWVRRAEGTTLRRLEDEVEFWELLREERPEVWSLLRGGPLPEGIVLVPGKPPRLHECAPGGAAAAEAGAEATTYREENTLLPGATAAGAGDSSAGRDDGDLHGCAHGGSSRALAGEGEACAGDGLHERACGGSPCGARDVDKGADDDDLHGSAWQSPIDARSFLAALDSDERALPLPERRCTIRMRTDRVTRLAWADSTAAYRSQSAAFLEEWEVLALVIREFWATWDNSQTRRQRRENPTLERDGWRCAVPGCRSVGTGRLNSHHIIFKSQQGPLTDPRNLTGICRGHHAALHDDMTIRCTGDAPDGLLWELGVSPGAEPFLVYRGEQRVGGVAS